MKTSTVGKPGVANKVENVSTVISVHQNLIRDRFIVGINEITLMTKLINSAVKDPSYISRNNCTYMHKRGEAWKAK
ncbi:hypothetical protein LSH36_517g04000 [Paralvinella palmiformis]|uniref:Uncharacterized protein n=1 Tax=Paralvinella palmiformis TaxID=53620 RepID=A0AAD9MXR5_9ANNE|nr:hypothetical protein LSH36_517g04000 [Paralvinella palmiformis]